MSLATAYWILMLLWLILGLAFTWPNYRFGGIAVLLFVVLVILGWKVFGPPIHG